MEKDLRGLSFPEKMEFFEKLKTHYLSKTTEFHYKKWLVLELFLQAVDVVFKWEERELTDKELEAVLMTTFSPAYIESIIDKDNPDQKAGIETWIGCIYGLLEGDAEVYAEELAELGEE